MFFSTVTLVALAAAASLGTTPSAAASRPRIVALGDSLTSGHGIGATRAFPSTLQQRLDEKGYAFTVVNAGVSGDTSGRAAMRVRDALEGNVQVLILALGANDGLRGVPVADLKRNLSRIIEQAQARNIAVLLCAMEALPMYGWEYTVSFHQAYIDLARTYRVPLVPFMMMHVLGNPALMQPDHVHPNADGARVMADQIWPFLERLLDRSAYVRRSGT